MSNELVVAQTAAINNDEARKTAMDDVTLYVNNVEEQLSQAEQDITETLPKLQAAADNVLKSLAAAKDAGTKEMEKKVKAKFAGLVKCFAAKGFLGLEVYVDALCDDTKMEYHTHVELRQRKKGSSLCEAHLIMGIPEEPKRITMPYGKTERSLLEQLQSLRKSVQDAQQELLKIKMQQQQISKYERQGKSLVIKAERSQTAEGRKRVELVEKAAEARTAAISAYTKELAKSAKLLAHSK